MNNNLRGRVVDTFGLTADQRTAAFERGRDVVVTAGAGSGKTRTLVARYASLLADGFSPRGVTAITFTEKAAREMRSRMRQALNDLVQQAATDMERQRWVALNAEMDSARIGTIHSLCSEILRAHPAEAGIDPKFDVIDEGVAAALRAQLVEEVLATLVGRSEFAPLFAILGIDGLSEVLAFLLDHRLEAQETFDNHIDGSRVIYEYMNASLHDPTLSDCINDLRSMGHTDLLQDAGEKLAAQVEDLLALWTEAENAFAAGDLVACTGYLFRARREKMKGGVGTKTSQSKGTVAELKAAYDRLLNPIVGGEGSRDQPPDADSEACFNQASALIRPAYQLLSDSYKEALRQRRSLDFDDLEGGAAQLLKLAEIRLRWQGEIDALLVDEFQDTNERQRQIVEALAGSTGKLFVVGDARQSIYRFRRADVTVFREIQERVKKQGGLVIDLDLTYRAHEPLLNATGDLLAAVMKTEDDPSRPYYVPFSPLKAHRKTPPDYMSNPHIELVLGAGEDTPSARPVAARALAMRLIELKSQKQIRTWDDVTLLLRASTGFAYYENAFEETGIPFVTVAGRGFYDRPEIRDIINILRALADPADDLAMAGLLRSPAFGLSDAALYQLRWQTKDPIPYWKALQGDLSILDEPDQPRAVRTLAILNDLLPDVDRIPVSELLKRMVDATDYRSILAVDDTSGTGGRLWRNLDKLLSDAQTSGQVNVRDFLDYLTTINEAGAREGEAPAEAQGAVSLMTIHKSKGLEFPVVVLADASREPRSGGDNVYLMSNLGLAFKMDPAPMLFRLAKWQDQNQNEAETMRLLYVALTRAKDKLIVSGHTTPTTKGEWTTKAWLGELSNAAEVDINGLVQQAGTEMITQMAAGESIRSWVIPAKTDDFIVSKPPDVPIMHETDVLPIYQSLLEPAKPIIAEDEPSAVHPWRATGPAAAVPPGVIGSMVHKAIELWLFPDNPQLIPLLETAALNAGLAQSDQCSAAVRHALDFLTRLQNHPLREEIEASSERYHEMPYSRAVNDHAETGYLDLLYCSSDGWQIVDFKTDSIRSAAQHAELVSVYTRQMHRYTSAVETLIGQKAQTRICFLDDIGHVSLVTV